MKVKNYYSAAMACPILLLVMLMYLQECTTLPTTSTATQLNVTSSAAPKNESSNQPGPGVNKDKDAAERVMYSYAEAVVDTEGTPSVHQLTIAKGKDGEFRFAKNENGTVETGSWKGPLPVSPVEPEVEHAATVTASKTVHENSMSSIVNQVELVDPLTEFNKNVGNTLQDYIFKKLMPFQFTF